MLTLPLARPGYRLYATAKIVNLRDLAARLNSDPRETGGCVMSQRTRIAWIQVALTLPAFLVLLALTCLALYPSRAKAEQPAANPTSMSFPATGVIRMGLNKGAIEVVGTAVDKISVSWRSADPDLDRDVSVQLQRTGDKEAKVVLDGPANRVRYRIEVPSECDVVIRMTAGDLDVHGIVGTLDAGLSLGNMVLRVGEP